MSPCLLPLTKMWLTSEGTTFPKYTVNWKFVPHPPPPLSYYFLVRWRGGYSPRSELPNTGTAPSPADTSLLMFIPTIWIIIRHPGPSVHLALVPVSLSSNWNSFMKDPSSCSGFSLLLPPHHLEHVLQFHHSYARPDFCHYRLSASEILILNIPFSDHTFQAFLSHLLSFPHCPNFWFH